MKKLHIQSITAILLFLGVFGLNAQSGGIKISGTVLENISQQPLEFATILIADANTKEPITGTTTGMDGSFEVSTKSSDIYVEVSFLGFQSKKISEINIENGKVNLGTISLASDNETLNEVEVRAEKSTTEFKLDKRVFNVGKDLSSTGASALEVLNNVPSVNVNIEGEISLRGSSGVQILVNGKPSVIASEQGNTLGTITADMIDKIEVITNPSAKYEAEGTSGIINIVIKKEERKGLNGAISVNTGVPHNHSVGLSLNKRSEKFNLFSQFGVGYRELPRNKESINQDFINNTILSSIGTEYRNETFYNVILGTDYYINSRNIITLSGNFAYEVEDQPSQTAFLFSDEAGTSIAEWNREETTEATNPKWQFELQYKRDFKDNKDHHLLFSALGNFFGKDQSSEFGNNVVSGTYAQEDQQTRTNFKEAKFTFQLDYTRPFSKSFTLETGAHYVMTDVSNDYEVKDFEDGVFITNPGLTNIFEYDQKVLGLYATGAYEVGKWGLKLGIRVENTNLETLLTNTGEDNQQNYTNLFPTVHTSYKISDAFSVQAGYSRRVSRPRLWDLNPFFNIRNNFNVRTGNPNLLPEFTDSYELTSIFIFENASMNFGAYYRYTTDVVERISTFENNVNTTQPENVGTNQAVGLEFNAKYTPTKWFSLNGDMNYFYFNREGMLAETNFDFSGDQFTSKATTKFKLPAGFEFEITGHYRSKYETVQGMVSSNVFADMGLRKKIMKGRGVFNMSLRDMFASRVRESEIIDPEYYLYNYHFRGRFLTFGFSYGFGKGDAMEYSGQKRR
ncbi:MAG: outer membrane beta-barrel family protein [Bacteroidota bacterium]